MHFEASRLALVDTVGNNLVVRGPMPLTGPSKLFAYKEISDTLKIDISQYFFRNISLIDNQGEAWAFYPELTAFNVPSGTYPSNYWPPYLQKGWNPPLCLGKGVQVGSRIQTGCMAWWPIEGFPKNESPKVYLERPGWDFSGVVDYVIALSQSPMKTIVYFHCMLGADRTGALHAGYLMKSRSASIAGATTMASTTGSAGAPAQNYLNLIKAYGESLGLKK
jgi:hypothetical protein